MILGMAELSDLDAAHRAKREFSVCVVRDHAQYLKVEADLLALPGVVRASNVHRYQWPNGSVTWIWCTRLDDAGTINWVALAGLTFTSAWWWLIPDEQLRREIEARMRRTGTLNGVTVGEA